MSRWLKIFEKAMETDIQQTLHRYFDGKFWQEFPKNEIDGFSWLRTEIDKRALGYERFLINLKKIKNIICE